MKLCQLASALVQSMVVSQQACGGSTNKLHSSPGTSQAKPRLGESTLPSLLILTSSSTRILKLREEGILTIALPRLATCHSLYSILLLLLLLSIVLFFQLSSTQPHLVCYIRNTPLASTRQYSVTDQHTDTRYSHSFNTASSSISIRYRPSVKLQQPELSQPLCAASILHSNGCRPGDTISVPHSFRHPA